MALHGRHRITRDEVEGREDNLRRGASLVTGCGGFFAASDPSSWVGLTVCVCSRSLRAHDLLRASVVHPGLSAPPQLTTTHPPPTPFFPPGLSLPPSSASDVAAHSPIFAYGGLPPPAPGRTIDRRNVSAERARNAVAVAHNAPRIRTSGSSRVVSAPVQGSSVTPISATAHAADHEDEECLNFMLYPMVHPASPDHPGAHPGAVLQFSGERFTQLARQTEAWHYVMTIKLPKTGQVWDTFGRQVVDHCQRHRIELPGFDASKPFTSPQDLPFHLLSSSPKSKAPVRVHIICDDIGATDFTLKTLLEARFTHLSWPLPGPRGSHRLLRGCVRYGDTLTHLDRELEVYRAPNVFGLDDFERIQCRDLLHPCGPRRLLACVVPLLKAECVRGCPTSSQGSEPSTSTAALDEMEIDEALNRRLDTPSPPPISEVIAALQNSSPLFVPDSDNEDILLPPLPQPDFSAMDPDLLARATFTRSPNDGQLLLNIPLSPIPVGPPAASSSTHHALPPLPRRSTRNRVRPRPVVRQASGSAHQHDELTVFGEPSRPTTPPPGEQTPVAQPPLSPQLPDSEVRPWNRRRTESPVPSTSTTPPAGEVHESLHPPSGAELLSWAERVRALIPNIPEDMPPPHFRAPSAQMAADMLIALIRWHFENPEGPVGFAARASFRRQYEDRFPGPGCLWAFTSLASLIRRSHALSLEIGDSTAGGMAIGDSPTRTVMRLAVQTILANGELWQPMGRFHTIRTHIGGPQGVHEREVSMKTAGFLALMHMAGGHGGPFPASPFLLRHVVEGRSSCSIDHAFMRLIDPDLYDGLRLWVDHDKSDDLPASPSNPLFALLTAADIDPHACSRPPSAQDLLWIEQTLVSFAALGAKDISQTADFRAFQAGMTHVLPAGTTLAELFEGRSRDFIAAMCNHQLESTDTLIPHIHFESTLDRELIQAATANSDFIDNDTWDVLYENLFEERLLRYLRGTGHPDHPDVIAVVGVEEYSRSLGDPVLRSRLFLHTVSGSDLVPLDPNWKLRIKFRHRRGRREPDTSNKHAPLPRALEVHSCFYDCVVTVDAGLRNLLLEPPPYAAFEAWIHGAFLSPELYNAV
ncbi:hypothetical protein C8Q76DRAFT_804192 [Earliella scabrosa]|nr:hypothetical protein C8Q76DRAFT_804192 [Earliella scabrosa]